MKTSFKLALPVMLVILLVAAADKPAVRIATVDLNHVFEKYYRHDLAMKAVEQETADDEKKLKAMEDEGQKMVEERDKLSKDMGDPMITAQERDAIRSRLDSKIRDIASKQNELRTFATHAEQELGVKRDRVAEQLIKEIRVAVDSQAKSGGYTLVIDTSAINVHLGSPAVMYSSGDNDLTEEVLKQINAAAPVTDVPAIPAKPGK